MASTLLTTKLRIPPAPRHLVPRTRLTEVLDAEIRSSRLALVAAPAGYGKTTLLAAWARTASLPVGWLSLDSDDDYPARFFQYFLSAWDAVQPGIMDQLPGILLDAEFPDIAAVLDAIVDSATRQAGDLAIVIDDVHLLGDESILDGLAYLLDHLPPVVHLVMAGRAEPRLPLARYRARGELLELGLADLQFSDNEAGAFLNDEMHAGLEPDQLVSLQGRLEGWIAGLQLVSLARTRGVSASDPADIGPPHRFIADYLNQDVLSRLPGHLRDFLVRTSILEHVCGPLGDAVTGRSDSQEMLERAEREQLFLLPLDDHRAWFRLHPLFADVLRGELQRRFGEEAASLHGRAGHWYFAQGMPEPAFRHAVAADDAALGARILERYTPDYLNTGRIPVLQHWLATMPESWEQRYPAIGLTRAGVSLALGAVEDGVRYIDTVEARLHQAEGDEAAWQRGMVSAVRCFIACFQNDIPRAETHAADAIRDLRTDDTSFIAAVHHALGDTYRRNGRWQEAREHYRETLWVAGTASVIQAGHVQGALADLEMLRGRLRVSHSFWSQSLATFEERENRGLGTLPVTGWAHVRLAELLYEWNDLPAAQTHLAEGMLRADLGGDVQTRIAGDLLSARLRLAEGDPDAPQASLENAGTMLDQAQFPELGIRLQRIRLEVLLAQDRRRAIRDWLDEVQATPPGQAPADLAIVRALAALGDVVSRQRGMAITDAMIRSAEGEQRLGVLIEALALRALLCKSQGETAEAMVALDRALQLAEPEGFARLFLDLGLPMAKLLQEAAARHAGTGYGSVLLAAFSPGGARSAGQLRTLPEPLTPREQDVLRLIVAGLTNREIADSLFISPETVKKHTSRVYAKLGVDHRTEAIARTRDLDLLA